MKHVLAICNTPLQIICAVNLKNTFYREDSVEIIISDHMHASRQYVDAIRTHSLFDDTYYVESFAFCRGGMPQPEGNFFKKLCFYKDRAKIMDAALAKMLQVKKRYDVLLLNNQDGFARVLHERLRRDNRNLKVYLFEDGYSSYYVQGVEWKKLYDFLRRPKQRLKTKIFNMKPLELHIDGQYLYRPEEVEWEAPFARIGMQEIRMDDEDMRRQLSLLFGYDESENYEQPVLFFEESYRREGTNINDVELLEKIADVVGKDNILVKPHPRSSQNIFQERGFRTVKASAVPWEVVVMNHPEYARKLLVSICSGSIATPYTMFKMETRSLVLLDLINADLGEVYFEKYFTYMRKRIFSTAPHVFMMPQSEAALTAILREWKKTELENA